MPLHSPETHSWIRERALSALEKAWETRDEPKVAFMASQGIRGYRLSGQREADRNI